MAPFIAGRLGTSSIVVDYMTIGKNPGVGINAIPNPKAGGDSRTFTYGRGFPAVSVVRQ